MPKKTIYGFAVLFLAAFACVSVFAPDASLAKKDDAYILPESAGVYDVPGKPDMKLKVIVYHAKEDPIIRGGKVQPAQPTLKCVSSADFDKDSSSVVAAAGWKLPTAWNYQVNLSSVPSTIGTTNANDLIAKAYGTWKTVLGGSTTFNRGANTTASTAKYDGQNIVTWGRASGTTLAVTYIWYGSNGIATEIDTIMNNRFTWHWSNPSSWPTGEICAYQGVYDAQGILTHELGHTVGLDDEYTDDYINNTMYGYGDTGDAKESTLATGDILGAKAVYGL